MADPHIRAVGETKDADGNPVLIGIEHDWVAIQCTLPLRLGSHEAEEFAQMFVAACWEAARQGGQLAREGDAP